MLEESSDYYLSDSSSTTSSTVHTNNTSGDEPDNNNQLYSLITLHPGPPQNHLVTTNSIQIQINGSSLSSNSNSNSNDPTNPHRLVTINGSVDNISSNSLLEIVGGGCDSNMLVETGNNDSSSVSDNGQVTTTTVVNGDGEAEGKKKNPVGRRKLNLSTREKTLRRLESNERERLRMHSLNQAFQVSCKQRSIKFKETH